MSIKTKPLEIKLVESKIINFDKIINYFNEIYHERYRFGPSVDHITLMISYYFINNGVIDIVNMNNNIKTTIDKIKNENSINDVYDLITYFLIYIKKNESMELIHNTQILKYEYYENDSESFYQLLDDIIIQGNTIYGQYNDYVFNIIITSDCIKPLNLTIKNITSNKNIEIQYSNLFNFFKENNVFTSSNYIIFITLINVDAYNDKYTTLNKIIRRNYLNINYEYNGTYMYGFLYEGLIILILNDNIKIIFNGICEYNYIKEGYIQIIKNDEEILNFSIGVINTNKTIQFYLMYLFNPNKIEIIQGYFNNDIFNGYISLFEDKKKIYVKDHNINTNNSKQLEIRTIVNNDEIIYVYSKGINYLGSESDIIKYKYTINNSMKYVGAWDGYGKIHNIDKKTCHYAKSNRGNVLWECEKCKQHIIQCDASYYKKKYFKYKKKYFKLLNNYKIN